MRVKIKTHPFIISELLKYKRDFSVNTLECKIKRVRRKISQLIDGSKACSFWLIPRGIISH